MKKSKGSVLDMFVILVLLFASAIGIVVASKVFNSFRSAWTPTDTTAQQIIGSGVTAVKSFNAGFLIFTVGLGIAAIIGAFLVPTHPIFFFLSFILLGIVLLIAPQFSNAWNVFINADDFATIGNDFPIMVEIMRNLPKILFGIGSIVLIAMYGKMNQGGY